MSISEDLRLERLERREAGGVTAAGLRKRLARTAPAVTEINEIIAAVNALLPEWAAPVSPISWRPNPDGKRLRRPPKWRLDTLDLLIANARSEISSVGQQAESLKRHLAPGGDRVDDRELDLLLREIRVSVREVDARGQEIDSRPKLQDWFWANPTPILAGAFIAVSAMAIGLIALYTAG